MNATTLCRQIPFLTNLFLMSLQLQAQSPARNGKDYAVFFVATTYKHGWSDLPDALEEAQLLAADLGMDYDFEVKIVKDPQMVDIDRILGTYKSKKFQPDDQLLVFFSMHGYHDKGSDKGYLIPVDGLYDDPTFSTWYSHSHLSEILQTIPCRRILLSLDACYSGIFGRMRGEPGKRPQASGDNCQQQLQNAFSGTEKTNKYVTAGGDQRVPSKSEFVRYWHKALREGDGPDGLLTFAELTAVLNQFNEPRPVWGDFNTTANGEFVFVRKNRCAPVADEAKSEEDAWARANRIGSPEAYMEYIRDFSKGLHFTEALDKYSAFSKTQVSAKDTIAEDRDHMILVPGGVYQIGSGYLFNMGDATPEHPVKIGDFYLDRYEVTQALWRKVMGGDPPDLIFKGCDACPVEMVNWEEVQVFIQQLNKQTGKDYRLPTEAEWEYAARGGKQSRSYKYPGSDKPEDIAWFATNSGGKTHPVGQKRPNELGLYDMAGNVAEWCNDWYDSRYYERKSFNSPQGPSTGFCKNIRGGGWMSDAKSIYLPIRHQCSPSYKDLTLGFRLARSAPNKP